MRDIKIMVDTGSDIPEDVAERYNISVMPFLSIFGEESFVQRRDITNEEFFERLEKSDIFPKTSQTPYADMYDFLLKESAEHESVIYFALSARASGQFQTANIVKTEILESANPNADIHIVDSNKFSVYIAQTAVHAAQMVQEGKTVEEILTECEHYIKTWRCYLLVDTLKYLEKGGRLSKTAAFVGTLLDVKPILTIEHGLVENLDKLRGKKKLVDKLIAKIQEDPDFIAEEKKEFLIVQSDDARGMEASEKLSEEYGDDCIKLYAEFGPLIATHVGRGAFAILCRIKI